MQRYQEESRETRTWLVVGSATSMGIGGGLFMAGSLWPLAGVLAIFAGLATLFVTGGGQYFKALTPGRKLIAIPGLVVGCVAVGVVIATVKILGPILKQDLLS